MTSPTDGGHVPARGDEILADNGRAYTVLNVTPGRVRASVPGARGRPRTFRIADLWRSPERSLTAPGSVWIEAPQP